MMEKRQIEVEIVLVVEMTELVGIGNWPEMVEGWWRRLVLVELMIELEVQVKMGLVMEEVKTRQLLELEMR